MTPEPCPICGSPNGTCVGSAPPPRQIIGANLYPSSDIENVVIIKDDVYEERVVVNSDGNPVTTNVLIVRAGDTVKESEARRLGISIP